MIIFVIYQEIFKLNDSKDPYFPKFFKNRSVWTVKFTLLLKNYVPKIMQISLGIVWILKCHYVIFMA